VGREGQLGPFCDKEGPKCDTKAACLAHLSGEMAAPLAHEAHLIDCLTMARQHCANPVACHYPGRANAT